MIEKKQDKVGKIDLEGASYKIIEPVYIPSKIDALRGISQEAMDGHIKSLETKLCKIREKINSGENKFYHIFYIPEWNIQEGLYLDYIATYALNCDSSLENNFKEWVEKQEKLKFLLIEIEDCNEDCIKCIIDFLNDKPFTVIFTSIWDYRVKNPVNFYL